MRAGLTIVLALLPAACSLVPPPFSWSGERIPLQAAPPLTTTAPQPSAAPLTSGAPATTAVPGPSAAPAATGQTEPPSPAQASSPPPPGSAEARIEEALAALDELRFDDALALARSITPSDPPKTRMEALAISAIVHLNQGDLRRAEPVLRSLYELAPGYVLDDPSLPPRVTEAFAAEAARPHSRAVSLQIERGEDRLDFSLRATGANRVSLACRTGSAAVFTTVSVAYAAGLGRFRIPTDEAYGCVVSAFDEHGLPLGHLGNRKEPVSVFPPPPTMIEGPGIGERWWFWVTLVGLAATGVVTGLVAAGPPEPDLPPADINLETEGVTVLSW